LILRRFLISKGTHLLRFLFIALLLAGCSLEKESGVNRSLQNLTAHYNILFNAKQLLQQKQDDYAASFVDSYDQLLSVYQDTAAHNGADKDLDAIITRANTIINIKEQSHYIGDAYLLLGKANFLYGNYFNAVEFFSYVMRSFPKQTELVQEARLWKVRSLLYLNQLPQAKLVSDTALQMLNPKSSLKADTYAVRLQYDIDAEQYAQAEEMAQKAVQYCGVRKQRLRWTFILAQLQELNHKPTEAYTNYSRVVHSNSSFEMAFNADLNRIRIGNNESGNKLSRIDELRALLKSENNKEFIDQIYYQIAQLYMAGNDLDNAIKNYHLSVRYSTRNLNQKGLSYLRLADIYFKNKADYQQAKKYYDSTLVNLSPNYPGYLLIQKKSNNLQILADRLQLIAREDTLQSLAKMNEKDRAAAINELVKKRITQLEQPTAPVNSGTSPPNQRPDNYTIPVATTDPSAFYFYNVSAVSQGYSDFKKRWGNRKLEDNWRRSQRPGSDITNNTQNTSQQVGPDALPKKLQKSNDDVVAEQYRHEISLNIPLTAQQMAESNLKVYNAYLDIANFYRDVLDDKKEAIATYELLLNRFPDDPNKPAIYYNLYRLYSDLDPAKSENFKNEILKKYPETPFAKVILDPDYNQHLNDKDAEVSSLYNKIYDLYAHKQYGQVVQQAEQVLHQYPDYKLAAQLMYLRAIAAGHNEKLDPFRADLLAIATAYPNDRLVTPLINQHLAYIDAHQQEMAQRPVVLVDNDLNEPFIPAPVVQQSQQQPQVTAAKPVVKPQAQTQQPATVQQPNAVTAPAAAHPQQTATAPAKPTPSIFSKRDSSNYYFVINVGTGNTNLSSSRFGIGQFNRANFQNNTIRHQLKPVGDDNQLIYIGRFYSLDAVKDYARAIIPLLPDIMKVPRDKYSFFIITQENLDKLADKKTLDSYVDYYQKNY